MNQKRIDMIVCGHIDHGKSTFVGRLLNDLNLIPQERINFLVQKSKDKRFEYAHLFDSLADEQSKGITIGLSQIAFKYKGQDYAFLDAPGHFEFMQNMITGASRADIAFIIVDAVEGVKESTCRHMYALSFMDVKKIVVLINKMDLINYSQERFSKIVREMQNHFRDLNMSFEEAIPISAYNGVNLTSENNKAVTWYSGKTVDIILDESSQKDEIGASKSHFRFVVQDKYSSEIGFNDQDLVVGEKTAGSPCNENTYCVFSNSKTERIKIDFDATDDAQDLTQFFIEKNRNCVTRGSLVYEENDKNLIFSKTFMCSIFLFGNTDLSLNEECEIRIAKQDVHATITSIERVIECSQLKLLQTSTSFKKGQAAICQLQLSREIAFDLFRRDPKIGRLVVTKGGVICAAGKIN